MKKLTKRVQAGGLWFDVKLGTKYLCVCDVGVLWQSEEKPLIYIYSHSNDWNSKSMSSTGYHLDLDGKNWRECCWYVGDQVDGDAAERREWMARGAKTVVSRLENGVVGADKYEGVCFSINIGKHALRDIRAGEVDL